MMIIGAIVLLCLAVDISSLLEISTKENNSQRSHFDSRDYISAFLRSDIRKIETVIKNLPKCDNRIKVSENGNEDRYNMDCKRTRRAFEGLLNIFKKLDSNYETYMEFSLNENIARQKKFQVVTRPTEATTPGDTGPGVIRYVICFVQSTRIFKSCSDKNKGASSDQESDTAMQEKYKMAFNKKEKGPHNEDDAGSGEIGITSDELMKCIENAYGVFQKCARGKKKDSSEENGDHTYRKPREEQKNDK